MTIEFGATESSRNGRLCIYWAADFANGMHTFGSMNCKLVLNFGSFIEIISECFRRRQER